MNIFFYAPFYAGYGTGNITRMAALYEFLRQSIKEHSLFFFSNSLNNQNILDKLGYAIKITNTPDLNFHLGFFDSPINFSKGFLENEKEISQIREFRKRTTKLIAFDLFNKVPFFDIAINLLPPDIRIPHTTYFTGLEYAIIKEEVLQQKSNVVQQPNKKVLITIGGEDKENLSQKVIDSFSAYPAYHLVVLKGASNTNILHVSKNIRVLENTQKIGEFINNSAFVISGAGNTLLEAIYLGKPTIVVPRNYHEKIFFDYLRQNIPLFQLDQVDMLINEDENFFSKIRVKYFTSLDGKGKVRIRDIVSSLHE